MLQSQFAINSRDGITKAQRLQVNDNLASLDISGRCNSFFVGCEQNPALAMFDVSKLDLRCSNGLTPLSFHSRKVA
jgi:hypothetical protein